MAYITFTDGTGAAQLDNGLRSVAGGVGSRFRNWSPDQRPVGASRTALGTGQRVMFPFRTDYTAKFELPEIPQTTMDIMLRLKSWLENGNTCAVYTEDTSSRSYATCGLVEGGQISLKRTSDQDLVWTISLDVVNLAGSPGQMLCVYSN